MKQHRLFGLLLAIVVLPFLVMGILVATKIAMLVTGASADERSLSFLVAALCLVPAGVLFGGLTAYGIIVFALSWIAPNHPLVAFANIETGLGRYLNPAFRAVHAFAIRFTPKR
jgi:hypothetical protein